MNSNHSLIQSVFQWQQDAIYKISRYEGARSLWSGLSPTLVLALPATICYFVTYEGARLHMKDFYLKWNPGKLKYENILYIFCF